MTIEINCRYVTSTYIATSKGFKGSASNTVSARHAADALAKQMGLNPALLLEQQRDLLRTHTRFIHPGTP